MLAGLGILEKLYEQRNSEDGQTDFEIRCGTDVHRVHKLIISAASPYFKKACNGPFKEAYDGVINLPEDDPQAVSAMIKFMYTSDYTQELLHEESCTEDVWDTPPQFCHCRLYLHAQTYGLGEKYCFSELNVFAGQVFRRALNFPHLSYETVRSAVAIVYEVTPDEDSLRKDILKAMVDRCFEWSTEDLENLMFDVPGSAKDIAVQLFEAIRKRDEEIVLNSDGLDQRSEALQGFIRKRGGRRS